MTRLVLVRHGHASGGWDDDLDPGLDDLGRAQAEAMADLVAPRGPLPILVSPLRRCRETAAPLERRWATVGTVDPAVGEIPSPPDVPTHERTTWLHAAMGGTWADLGAEYTRWRDSVVGRLLAIETDTVVVSHFVADQRGDRLGDGLRSDRRRRARLLLAHRHGCGRRPSRARGAGLRGA